MKGILNFDGLFQKLTHDKVMSERVKIGDNYNIKKNLF